MWTNQERELGSVCMGKKTVECLLSRHWSLKVVVIIETIATSQMSRRVSLDFLQSSVHLRQYEVDGLVCPPGPRIEAGLLPLVSLHCLQPNPLISCVGAAIRTIYLECLKDNQP